MWLVVNVALASHERSARSGGAREPVAEGYSAAAVGWHTPRRPGFQPRAVPTDHYTRSDDMCLNALAAPVSRGAARARAAPAAAARRRAARARARARRAAARARAAAAAAARRRRPGSRPPRPRRPGG